MQKSLLFFKQSVLLVIMYATTLVLTVLLFLLPVFHIFGLKAVISLFYQIMPTILLVFILTFIIAAIWIILVFFTSLEKYIQNYQAFLSGAETTLSKKEKHEGFRRTESLYYTAGGILAATPLLCYLILLFIESTTRGSVVYDNKQLINWVLGLINLIFGLSIFKFYTEVSKTIFRELHKACELTLQDEERSSMGPLHSMAIDIMLPCVLVLSVSYVMFALKQDIHNRVTSEIVKNTYQVAENRYQNARIKGFEQEVQNIYELVAFHYPVSINITWNNISFFRQIENSGLRDVSLLNTLLRKFKSEYYLFFWLLLISMPSWLKLLLSCKAFRFHLNDVFIHVRKIIKGESNFSRAIYLTSFDEVGYLSGYLNLLTTNSENIAKDAQQGMEELRSSLDKESDSGEKLCTLVEKTRENIVYIEQNLGKSKNQVQAIDSDLGTVQKQIVSVNESLNKQRKYVDLITNEVHNFAALTTSVRQVAERANHETRAMMSSVDRGKESVQNLVSGMKQIAQSSEAMESIVGAIARVAAQTSLLSMNAAIEAAHAGEYGSGFAVLAQEVRSLSESATLQSRAIRQQIETLVQSVQLSLTISGNTTEILGELSNTIESNDLLIANITKAMMEQSNGSKEIVRLIESAVNRDSKIRSLTSQQNHKNQEIDQEIKLFGRTDNDILDWNTESKDFMEDLLQCIYLIAIQNSENMQIIEETSKRIATITNKSGRETLKLESTELQEAEENDQDNSDPVEIT